MLKIVFFILTNERALNLAISQNLHLHVVHNGCACFVKSTALSFHGIASIVGIHFTNVMNMCMNEFDAEKRIFDKMTWF